MLLEVTISGTIGKQVIPTARQATLLGVTVTPSATNATIKIRDGNASGEVVFFAMISAGETSEFYPNHKFTKGMHVKVLGTAAVAYLVLE